MLDNKGFDLWADGYDKTVGVSEEGNTYPFAGYKDVLGTIFKTIMKKPSAVVLDIGFGTGTLTTKLYGNGCTIYGQDFSARSWLPKRCPTLIYIRAISHRDWWSRFRHRTMISS